ncbi:DUF1850 domain-containing protein [Halobacterium salinarum]|uniref:DUF1850 domain-containing protein n=1 Tax=Halobacterium TaxID=2239 RepID=UPI001964B347|nr:MULTISPECIES: DUF1850 domain-containing protein [Halobacterium]MCF2165626.1 DUF1850 domain-containing protein [Halobacterium salinarum]MCF2168902.1 DUF1850 domain-containing protein [Halobacterium salinarum]MCF2238922.1 DUF1850 domain-containing protein [Halobacterium salinarum]MDL0140361.1 DUF1850 domain-containing protein [Halobacterium salinarum]QRY23113.1 DUF1850 domain-containing protein [Halobacterium sp. GSL-19]
MNRTRIVVVAASVLAVLTVIAAVVPAGTVLVADDTDTDQRYLTVPVSEGSTVALEYTHSVERSRVYEAYAVRGETLEMTRAEFESYGWGFPSAANVTIENGTFVYSPDRNATVLTVSPGRIAGHTLHVDDRSYDLVSVTDAQSVDLHVVHRTLLATMIESIYE